MILVVALLLLLPLLLYAVVAVFDRLQTRFGSAATRIAVIELRSPKTRARSIAIAATGAIAVFGSVAIQGAHANLQRGLDRLAHDAASAADLWVVPPGTQDLLATTPFHDSVSTALARLPGVRAVGLYRAGFLDYGDRHMWVLAPPTPLYIRFPRASLSRATSGSRRPGCGQGGWAVLSQAVAAQQHLHHWSVFTSCLRHIR